MTIGFSLFPFPFLNIYILFISFTFFCNSLLALTSVLTNNRWLEVDALFLKKRARVSYKVLTKFSKDLGIFNNYLLHCCCLNITYVFWFLLFLLFSVLSSLFLSIYFSKPGTSSPENVIHRTKL